MTRHMNFQVKSLQKSGGREKKNFCLVCHTIFGKKCAEISLCMCSQHENTLRLTENTRQSSFFIHTPQKTPNSYKPENFVFSRKFRENRYENEAEFYPIRITLRDSQLRNTGSNFLGIVLRLSLSFIILGIGIEIDIEF